MHRTNPRSACGTSGDQWTGRLGDAVMLMPPDGSSMKPQKLITNRADGERGEKGEEGTANVLCTDLSPSPTTLRRVSRSSDTLRERREGAPLFGSGRSRSLYAETGGWLKSLPSRMVLPDGELMTPWRPRLDDWSAKKDLGLTISSRLGFSVQCGFEQ